MVQSDYYKVRWLEGMLVSPQHFQQWDHYQDAMGKFHLRPLHPYAWGTVYCQFKKDQFDDCQQVAVSEFQGIFPSGTIVDIPAGDCPPPARAIDANFFRQQGAVIAVYLALPVSSSAAGNCPPNGMNRMEDRYYATTINVRDENSNQDDMAISVTRKNVKILFGYESHDNYERLQIGEIRVEKGKLLLADNDQYIPPSLILPQTAIWTEIIKLLEETADNIAKSIVKNAADRSNPFQLVIGDDQSNNFQELWLSGVLRSYIPLLKHFDRMPGLNRDREGVHPEMAYRSLLQLASQLSSLALTSPPKLPEYNHEDIYGTFNGLKQIMEGLLSVI